MVTPDGVVKVLDFGLEKLMQDYETSGEDATTLEAQARLSHPGMVPGTPESCSTRWSRAAALSPAARVPRSTPRS